MVREAGGSDPPDPPHNVMTTASCEHFKLKEKFKNLYTKHGNCYFKDNKLLCVTVIIHPHKKIAINNALHI